jgi:hypothetical protein
MNPTAGEGAPIVMMTEASHNPGTAPGQTSRVQSAPTVSFVEVEEGSTAQGLHGDASHRDLQFRRRQGEDETNESSPSTPEHLSRRKLQHRAREPLLPSRISVIVELRIREVNHNQ